MRTIEVSRVLEASPPTVERALDPARIVEYEGSFAVREIDEREDDWLVTVGATGLELPLRFEELARGYYYEQLASGQPLDEMETTIAWEPVDQGTRVTATSSVSMGLPPAALTDRIAAWKRRGELERALESLAEDVE